MTRTGESFEKWLLHRVAQAVEAGEVPADLLTEFQAEFDAAREKPMQEGHAAAIRHIAELAGVSGEEAANTMAATRHRVR